MIIEPSNNIQIGRRVIDGLEGIEIIEDLRWCSIENLWYIYLSITNVNDEKVCMPKITYWYITIPNEYPRGSIHFYPCSLKGIKETFEHQTNNGIIAQNGLWKSGYLCLENPLNYFEEFTDFIIPENANEKILWYTSRALQWIKLANRNELWSNDDKFELPYFKESYDGLVGFSENRVDFEEWEDVEVNTGIVHLHYFL